MSDKLCTGCKYLSRNLWCISPRNGTSLVHGTPTPKFAVSNRARDGGCGYTASWYVPAEPITKPWWKFW